MRPFSFGVAAAAVIIATAVGSAAPAAAAGTGGANADSVLTLSTCATGMRGGPISAGAPGPHSGPLAFTGAYVEIPCPYGH